VEHYDEGVSEDSRRVDIDRLEEAHCAALVQSARYLEGIRRYHDRNVGDLVLRRIQNTEGLHKLSSPWEGPFTVAKVTGPGSCRLQESCDGERGFFKLLQLGPQPLAVFLQLLRRFVAVDEVTIGGNMKLHVLVALEGKLLII
jgi:hypothetical protein